MTKLGPLDLLGSTVGGGWAVIGTRRFSPSSGEPFRSVKKTEVHNTDLG